MSFPSSPLNNQVAVVNNITYKYVSSTNTWNRIATSNVGFFYVTATTLNANNEAYVGGISILPFTQSAFNAANTVSNNITIIQGVNTTQNTNITVADTKAQAAFDSANVIVGVNTTQNTNITVIQGVDTAQNTRMSVIEGVDATQNSNITIIQGVDVSQNTRMSIIEGVDVTQNTNITSVNTYAASAYGLANTVNSGLSANVSLIAGINTTQNNNITTVNTLAQAAFDKANTASNGSNASSILTSTVDTFTGNGSNTSFTLTVQPTNINYTTAVVGGVSQPRSAYSVLGATVTFTSAPANGQIVEVTTIGTSNSTLYTVNNILSPFLLMGA